jgi:glycosyltransferase involved in cell wall biosynthesis
VRNLSLAARTKVELIAELLHESSHDLEILSQGEVIESKLRLYPGFREAESFHPKIPVYYASAFPLRFVNGLWSGFNLLRLFKRRHQVSPFDLIMIYDLKLPQVACAHYAIQKLNLPVILEYEDDAFADHWGRPDTNPRTKWQRDAAKKLLNSISGGFGCAPYLLEQISSSVPKLLLRGVVSNYIANANGQASLSKTNRVVFSGTLEGGQGVEQLVTAWKTLALPDWELHIAGVGPIKPALEKIANQTRNIVFHGYLNKENNGALLCTAKIGMNPQDVAHVANTFPFKIIEYLAAGTHVITTPRGTLEPQLDAGITYITDNTSETIGASLKKVITERQYERTARPAALQTYGPDAVTTSLNRLIAESKAVHGNGIASESRKRVT